MRLPKLPRRDYQIHIFRAHRESNEPTSFEDRLDFARLKSRVRDCFKRLTPRTQKYLVGLYQKGLSNEAVGEEFSVSKQAVSNQARKGLRELKRCVDANGQFASR